jgi:glycosyltransferase involved in cell wall biosynthesis
MVTLAYISDQRFYKDASGAWYTTASFPLDSLASLFPFVNHWIIFGRFEDTQDGTTLYCLPLPEDATVEFIGAYHVPRGPLGYLLRLPDYVAKVRQAMVKADIAWLKTPFLASYLAWMFRHRGQILITHMVGDAIEPLVKSHGRVWGLLAWGLARTLLRAMHGRADISAFVSKDLRRRYDRPGAHGLVVNESRVTEQMIRTGTRRPGDYPRRILFVGRLSPEKGLATLLGAAALVAKRLPIELVFVGAGPQRRELEGMASRLGVPVVFLGQVPWGERLWAVFDGADAFVLPSVSEGLPLVLVEAMCRAVPVVASRVGGIPELVEDGVSGILVRPNDIEGLSEAIVNLLTDEDLRDRLVNNASQVVRENTLERQIGRLADATYRRLKGGG